MDERQVVCIVDDTTLIYITIYYYEHNHKAGLVRLKQITDHFSHCVWLSPEPPRFWNHPTCLMIGKVFPMFELTLDGLQQAVKKLIVKR